MKKDDKLTMPQKALVLVLSATMYWPPIVAKRIFWLICLISVPLVAFLSMMIWFCTVLIAAVLAAVTVTRGIK